MILFKNDFYNTHLRDSNKESLNNTMKHKDSSQTLIRVTSYDKWDMFKVNNKN